MCGGVVVIGHGFVSVVRDGLTKMASEWKPERQLCRYLGEEDGQLLHIAWGEKVSENKKCITQKSGSRGCFFVLFCFFPPNRSEAVLSAFLYKLHKAEFRVQSTVMWNVKMHSFFCCILWNLCIGIPVAFACIQLVCTHVHTCFSVENDLPMCKCKHAKFSFMQNKAWTILISWKNGHLPGMGGGFSLSYFGPFDFWKEGAE